jgi:xanthine dehydrogenase YagS FAD-binding subunit
MSFAYVRPRSLSEAASLLSEPGARALAGGTDLLGCLRDGIFSATTVVSLSDLAELKGVREQPDGGLAIGALTTLAEIAAHPRIRRDYGALADAAASAASPQLRNQGTLGGNLCQRPRCWYFRGGFHCARKGGDVCYAAEGENELHAIFGGTGCYAVHPSDTASPLVALEARARIVRLDGERGVGLDALFVGPGDDMTHETVLLPGELLAEVVLPPPRMGARSSYRKARARAAWDFALVGVALVLTLSRRRVERARVVLSGVAPVPWRVPAAEAILQGSRLDRVTASQAAAAATEGAEPLGGNAYKVDLVRGLVEQELLALA